MMISKRSLQFARAFFVDPQETGSIVPSSRFLARRMLRHVDWQKTRVIVELGPGTGCFTQRILRRMRRDAVLIAIESNAKLAVALERAVRDRRLRVVNGSALQLNEALQAAGVTHADVIVSGLPFANMEKSERLAILRTCAEALDSDGAFVLFQYRRVLLPALTSVFGAVRRDYEWRNLPPAHVFHCELLTRGVAGALLRRDPLEQIGEAGVRA